ncbi:MAG: acetyl-CoA carboxylase biotin carboxyl carrier protein [Cytophagales bacterium]|nr:acetyl-CoA carboxylase biotin carboxyl carrier protein [Cytophagales bacterium]
MKPKEIQEILEFIASSGLEEVNIETENLKLAVKRSTTIQVNQAPVLQPQVMTMPTQVLAANANTSTASKAEVKDNQPTPASGADANYKVIKSPMIGTFYRSPGPNEDVFVNVGDAVNVGTTVCIIEAMKLFNEIESEFAGKIVKILVQDSTPVEFDQPLFIIDPS